MKELLIGRSRECQILMDDVSVSRRHATLIISSGSFQVIDNNSTNGTFINGNRITGSRNLDYNDILKVGNVIVPWRNYINTSYTPQSEKGGTRPLPVPPPVQRIQPPKKSSQGAAKFISFAIAAVIIAGGVFYFMKQNSDKKKIIGKWQCIDNCDDLSEIMFDDKYDENTVEFKYAEVDGIRIKGHWRIIESRKRLIITPEKDGIIEDGDEETYDYYFRKDKLILEEIDGDKTITEFIKVN